MRVKCIDATGMVKITEGVSYEAVHENDFDYNIINNSGELMLYSKHRFKKEEPEKKYVGCMNTEDSGYYLTLGKCYEVMQEVFVNATSGHYVVKNDKGYTHNAFSHTLFRPASPEEMGMPVLQVVLCDNKYGGELGKKYTVLYKTHYPSSDGEELYYKVIFNDKYRDIPASCFFKLPE